MEKNNKIDIFENKPVGQALATMAIPSVISQLITLFYNVADTWFIGQTDNPYMVAAASLVATIFLMTAAVSNLFGAGGGALVVRLLGSKQEDEASKVASWSVMMAAGSSILFAVICLIFMNPMLRFLGASDNTIGYAKQYLLIVVVIGALPTILSNTMSYMLRNIGYSKEASFGLGMGGDFKCSFRPDFHVRFITGWISGNRCSSRNAFIKYNSTYILYSYIYEGTEDNHTEVAEEIRKDSDRIKEINLFSRCSSRFQFDFIRPYEYGY